jgi:hypothetical protein
VSSKLLARLRSSRTTVNSPVSDIADAARAVNAGEKKAADYEGLGLPTCEAT